MKKRELAEQEIDEIVTSEANDISKWEEPISVKPSGAASIRLSPRYHQKSQVFR